MRNGFDYLTYMVGECQQEPIPRKKLREKKRTERREKPLKNNRLDKIARFPGSYVEDNNTPRVVSKQTIGYDENGEIVFDMTRKPFRANGSGFVVSYTDKVCELLTKIKTGSILRVFFFIAHHQQYGTDGRQFGYRCSHKFIGESLGLERSVVWDALKFLRENYLVLESKVEGFSEFMVNPNYITIGGNKKERLKEWSRRWEVHFKNTGGKI